MSETTPLGFTAEMSPVVWLLGYAVVRAPWWPQESTAHTYTHSLELVAGSADAAGSCPSPPIALWVG